jgi:DNA repair exonuclease SbcCD ATPase subunit
MTIHNSINTEINTFNQNLLDKTKNTSVSQNRWNTIIGIINIVGTAIAASSTTLAVIAFIAGTPVGTPVWVLLGVGFGLLFIGCAIHLGRAFQSKVVDQFNLAEETKKTLENTGTTIDKLNKDINDLNNTISENGKTNVSLKQKLTNAETELKNAKNDINTLEQEKLTVETKLTNVEITKWNGTTEYKILNKAIDDVKQSKEEVKKELETEKELNNKILEKNATKIKEKETEIENLGKKIKTLNTQIENSNKKISDLESDKLKLTEDIKKNKGTSDETLKKQLEDQTKEIKQLKTNLEFMDKFLDKSDLLHCLDFLMDNKGKINFSLKDKLIQKFTNTNEFNDLEFLIEILYRNSTKEIDPLKSIIVTTIEKNLITIIESSHKKFALAIKDYIEKYIGSYSDKIKLAIEKKLSE